jgi:hypothetical protein
LFRQQFTLQASSYAQLQAFKAWLDWRTTETARCENGCELCREERGVYSLSLRHPTPHPMRYAPTVGLKPSDAIIRSLANLTHLTLEPFPHDMIAYDPVLVNSGAETSRSALGHIRHKSMDILHLAQIYLPLWDLFQPPTLARAAWTALRRIWAY